MDSASLRSEFPVFERHAYLNAGTNGPLPAKAVQAAEAMLRSELQEGRAHAHFERRGELKDSLRTAYAAVLGCSPEQLAITTSTTEGMTQVLFGLGLKAGDEVVTSDEEHPGLLGPLGALAELSGVSIREVPLAQVAEAVGGRTRLVACSHVSWATGCYAPAELADVDVPVLLDGAQGVGAVAVDVEALGCDAYSGAGQKWMCGPESSGMLYVEPELRERLEVTRRGYGALEDPNSGLQARLRPDAQVFDSAAQSAEAIACALASAELLASFGMQHLHERAAALAEQLVSMLRDAGREVVARDRTTLVSFASPDAEGEREALGRRGIVIRSLPNRPALRASVGAWNDERDLERLVEALAR